MKRHTSFFNIQALTSCISTSLVLILLGAALFVVLTAYNVSKSVRENISITMLMSDQANAAELATTQKTLKTKKYIREVKFISKEDAKAQMIKDLGTDPSEFLEYNPFEASYELTLHADYANKDSIARVVKELKAMPKVVDMVYQSEQVETINDIISKVSLVLLVLVGLLTFVSFALINNTLRLSAYSRRFLIHTMKLVGASWSFIRRPFLWKSMLLGLIAAIVADVVLYLGVMALLEYEPELIGVVTTQVQLIVAGSVLVFGLLITLFCAYISVNRFLKMNEKDLYTA